jgi:hypothetical protein
MSWVCEGFRGDAATKAGFVKDLFSFCLMLWGVLPIFVEV